MRHKRGPVASISVPRTNALPDNTFRMASTGTAAIAPSELAHEASLVRRLWHNKAPLLKAEFHGRDR